MSSKAIRVILADDHALVLEGLRSLLAAEPDMLVVGEASDGEKLLEVVKRLQPTVVIADIHMPLIDGLTCLGHIRRISPQTRVLILTAYTDGDTLHAADGGADGLLLKTDPPAQAVQAIRQVVAGQLIFPAAARRWLVRPLVETTPEVALSEREREVLSLVAEGLTNSQVSDRLHISENTVKFHLQNIYQRLNVTNRTEASRWYLQKHGKLEIGD